MSAPGRVEPADSAERRAPAIPSAEADRGAEPLRRRRRVDLAPYLLLLPATLFLLIFFVWPMVQALVLAVRDANGGLTLEHIQRMTGDLNFWDAVRNTLLLLVIIVPAQVILALIMALLINAGLRFRGAFLYIWTIPLAISDLAAGIVWLAIFTERGYVNSVLNELGLLNTPISFLSYENPGGYITAIVAAEVWRATAIVMVILVAGLQMIPRDYSEAAEVFGASGWQRLRHVILPMLRPSLQVALILRTILAFQVFAVVVALAGRNMPVLAGEAYYWYGSYRNAPVAASYALLILLLSIGNTYIYLRLLRSRTEELT
jgi:multiple sugar transport system permease protein